MHIDDWPLERIKPYAGNPRKRSKKAVEKVAASIREFVPRQPIVVDEEGVILVGHTRRDAAVSLGMATFPVHQALGLSEAQKCVALYPRPNVKPGVPVVLYSSSYPGGK